MTSAQEILAAISVIYDGRATDNGCVIVHVTAGDSDDDGVTWPAADVDRAAIQAIVEPLGWTTTWTGDGDSWGDGSETFELEIAPIDT